MDETDAAGAARGTVWPGVYGHRATRPSPLLRIEAALLMHPPSAFASHASAGRVYGVPLPVVAEEHASVFAEADRRLRGKVCHHLSPTGMLVSLVRGLRVSAPPRLFVELADRLGLVELVVVGCGCCSCWPGCPSRRCGRVASHSRGGSATTGERTSRVASDRLRWISSSRPISARRHPPGATRGADTRVLPRAADRRTPLTCGLTGQAKVTAATLASVVAHPGGRVLGFPLHLVVTQM